MFILSTNYAASDLCISVLFLEIDVSIVELILSRVRLVSIRTVHIDFLCFSFFYQIKKI